MTLANAKVLYAHRLKLGKRVDDILNIYPELAEKPKAKPMEVKTDGKKPKGRAD